MAAVSLYTRARGFIRRRGRASITETDSSVSFPTSTRTVIVAGLLLIWLLHTFGGSVEHVAIHKLQGYRQSDWVQFRSDYQRRFGGRTPPNSLQAWHRYAKYHGCSETDNYDMIHHDLEPFQRQINATGKLFDYSEVIPSNRRRSKNYIAFRLHDKSLTVAANSISGHFNKRAQKEIIRNFKWFLRPLVGHSPPLQNAVFWFDLDDQPPRTPPLADSTSTLLPIFSSCRMSYWTDNQPPPTDRQLLLAVAAGHEFPQYLHQEATHNHIARLAQKNIALHPDYADSHDSQTLTVPYYFGMHGKGMKHPGPAFSKRKDAIVWRGGTTGLHWGNSPRFQLIQQYAGTQPHAMRWNETTTGPVDFDFAFTNVVQNSSEKTLPPTTRFAPRMQDPETQQYKYILDIDGNAFTERFPRLLRSGSLIFKSTRFREWFSERVKPYVDYIPVNYNLSDLPEKLLWAHQHPETAEQIMWHGKKTSKQLLSRKEMQCYAYRLMLEYHSLFEKQPRQ